MKDGFIKVAVATPPVKVADCVYNGEQAAAMIKEADGHQVQLLVMPELYLTGYTCGDLFLQGALLEGALQALKKVVETSRGSDMLVVVGLPFSLVENSITVRRSARTEKSWGSSPNPFYPIMVNFMSAASLLPLLTA